jgi:hypothetical protein
MEDYDCLQIQIHTIIGGGARRGRCAGMGAAYHHGAMQISQHDSNNESTFTNGRLKI